MAKLQNTFSWSFTRHKAFEECRRRYYLTYYGSWNGWDTAGPDRARLAYRLKCMQTLPMWLGSLVHNLVERILGDAQNAEVRSLDHYQEMARKRMNEEWKQSAEGKWKWKPKYNLNLFEHYYGVEISGEERVAAREKVFRCLRHFLESELFAGLTRLRPTEWKSVEKLESFPVGGNPVWVKLDCSTQTAEGVTIYDWKTGKVTEDTRAQLGCYALYAANAWKVPLERQRLVSYYLDEDTVQEHAPAAAEVIETQDFILQSMQAMIEALDEPPPHNIAREEHFPKQTRLGMCRRCNFRELCFDSREWKDPA